MPLRRMGLVRFRLSLLCDDSLACPITRVCSGCTWDILGKPCGVPGICTGLNLALDDGLRICYHPCLIRCRYCNTIGIGLSSSWFPLVWCLAPRLVRLASIHWRGDSLEELPGVYTPCHSLSTFITFWWGKVCIVFGIVIFESRLKYRIWYNRRRVLYHMW